MKIDFGCGPNKREGFLGVDQIKFDGVDYVFNAGTDPFPWEDGCVEEAHSSHFLEHLTATQRFHFFNELWRVLKKDAQVSIITPHWASSRGYGDLTHQWPPVTEFFWFYLNRKWREENAPHTDSRFLPTGFRCNFDTTWGYTPYQGLVGKNNEFMQFAMTYYLEARQDMHATLTKRE